MCPIQGSTPDKPFPSAARQTDVCRAAAHKPQWPQLDKRMFVKLQREAACRVLNPGPIKLFLFEYYYMQL